MDFQPDGNCTREILALVPSHSQREWKKASFPVTLRTAKAPSPLFLILTVCLREKHAQKC